MKIYSSCTEAEIALSKKQKQLIDAYCPFQQDNNVCGSWCPFFYYGRDGIGPVVTLKCTGQDFKIQMET